MIRCRISLIGCDDKTVFERSVTKTAFALLQDIARQSQEVSTYSCMPMLTIEEIKK